MPKKSHPLWTPMERRWFHVQTCEKESLESAKHHGTQDAPYPKNRNLELLLNRDSWGFTIVNATILSSRIWSARPFLSNKFDFMSSFFGLWYWICEDRVRLPTFRVYPDKSYEIPWDPIQQLNYLLVLSQFALEHDRFSRGFSYWTWWFFRAMLVITGGNPCQDLLAEACQSRSGPGGIPAAPVPGVGVSNFSLENDERMTIVQ